MILRTVLAAVLLASPAALAAQAYQCRVPGKPVALPRLESGPERRAAVAGYTLAASWSPEYCRTRTQSKRDARQCSGEGGRFGMILHGLWPEGRPTSPQWCRGSRALRAEDLQPNLCMTPSAQLLAHEWTRHGSCMVERPASYFKVSRILWNSVRWPDLDRLSRREPTAGDLRQAFMEANPAWKTDQIGVQVNARGWLEGVRLCYGKDFMPRTCAKSQMGVPSYTPIKIWRGI